MVRITCRCGWRFDSDSTAAALPWEEVLARHLRECPARKTRAQRPEHPRSEVKQHDQSRA